MKIILLLLASTLLTSAAPRLADYLSTKTTTYGKNKTIAIVIHKHPTQEMVLVFTPALRANDTVNITIPAGEGLYRSSKRVGNRWNALLQVNGKKVDEENARRKTGMSADRVGL